MKKFILFTAFTLALPLAASAQDDTYFVPTKKYVEKAEREYGMPQNTYYSGSRRSVDEYNRMGSSVQAIDSAGNDVIDFDGVEGVFPDSASSAAYNGIDDNDYRYTRTMSRFDGYYWNDSFRAGYYAGISSRRGWYDSWYYYDPWLYSGWAYDPWYYGWAGYWCTPYYWGYPYYWGHHHHYYWPAGGTHQIAGRYTGTANRATFSTNRATLHGGNRATFNRATGRATVNTNRNTFSTNRSSGTFSTNRSSSGSFGGGRSSGGGGSFRGRR